MLHVPLVSVSVKTKENFAPKKIAPVSGLPSLPTIAIMTGENVSSALTGVNSVLKLNNHIFVLEPGDCNVQL